MRRIARDAVLIAITAAIVWFMRGDAQNVTPIGYGQQFQLVCTAGEIAHAAMFYEDFDSTLSLSWREPTGPESIHRRMSGYMNFTGCAAYPDLTAGQ